MKYQKAILISFHIVLVFPTLIAQESNDFVKSFPNYLQYKGIAVQEEDYYIWGASPVIGPDNKVNLFVARWPDHLGQTGWRDSCEIVRYISESPGGPFYFQEVVIKGEENRMSPHNPTIQKVDDKYVLLYITNNGKEGHPANQKICMRIAETLEGPWQKTGDKGLIVDVPSDTSIWCYGSRVGVNNPAFLKHPDGQYFIYYKASPKDGGERRFGVAIANSLKGPYQHYFKSVTNNYGKNKTIEDGYAFQHHRKFYIICRSKLGRIFKGYDGVLWVSDDGLSFNPHPGYYPAKHYFPDSVKKKMRITERWGELERPQVLMIDGKPSYLYACAGLSITKNDNPVNYVFKLNIP